MSERLRAVTVRIVVDTNKRTLEEIFDLESYDSLGALFADVRQALIELEEGG